LTKTAQLTRDLSPGYRSLRDKSVAISNESWKCFDYLFANRIPAKYAKERKWIELFCVADNLVGNAV